jgi:hypothetical protein
MKNEDMKKQVSMGAIHKDLQEIIILLKDIRRNQFFARASEDKRFYLTTNLGQVEEKLVRNALKEAGVCRSEHHDHGKIKFLGDISQSGQLKDLDEP